MSILQPSITDRPVEPGRIRWKWKNVLIIALIILAGFGLHVLSLWPSVPNLRDEFVRALVNQISTALLIGGVWAAVSEFVLRRDFLEILDNNADRVLHASRELGEAVRTGGERLHRQVAESTSHLSTRIAFAKQEETAGLVEVRLSSADYDFNEMILKSRKLIIISNDADTWTKTHAHALRQRFSTAGMRTVFILLHTGAPVLGALGHKYGVSAEALRRKINDTVELIDELRAGSGTVEVYGHHLVSAYSGYVGDSMAVMRPYFNSQGRHNLPLLRVENREGYRECLFQQIRADCEGLMLSSMRLL